MESGGEGRVGGRIRVGTGRIGDDEWGARRRPVVKHPRSSLHRLSLSCALHQRFSSVYRIQIQNAFRLIAE
jgi:hypothetical protein